MSIIAKLPTHNPHNLTKALLDQKASPGLKKVISKLNERMTLKRWTCQRLIDEIQQDEMLLNANGFNRECLYALLIKSKTSLPPNIAANLPQYEYTTIAPANEAYLTLKLGNTITIQNTSNPGKLSQNLMASANHRKLDIVVKKLQSEFKEHAARIRLRRKKKNGSMRVKSEEIKSDIETHIVNEALDIDERLLNYKMESRPTSKSENVLLSNELRKVLNRIEFDHAFRSLFLTPVILD